VTFLFTDIEGSTARWESDPNETRRALAAHDDGLRTAIEPTEAMNRYIDAHRGDVGRALGAQSL
jgi:class 3 adenylate cyclase